MKKIFFNFLCFFLFSLSVSADNSHLQIKQKLEKIERDITDLQRTLFTKNEEQISVDSENQSTSSQITVFDMRLRDIENELQAINLNYENISFEIDDLKKSLEELSLELNNAILILNNSMMTIDKKININDSSENNNVLEQQDLDESAQSQNEEINTLGTLTINSKDLSDSNKASKADEKIVYLSPEEQFQAAFDNIRSQKFEEAKSDFKLFIKENPSNVLAGSAHYWLGEIYFLQKEYREAALVFAEGYQKYPNSVKSPESLYKLAETLVKIEKKEEACNTFRQLILKYPENKLIEKSQIRINEISCG